ncbi:MAG: PAS domain S-box protein [Rhodocyclales bacterium]|nr:PAS domain S-box protein [Rhodocyclales bacterium]
MSAPLSVLIVEDSAGDADLMVRQLQHAGFDVTHERVDTREGMSAALEKRAWDVVLSDFRLPNFSAGEALATLRGSGLDTPFIVVSGVIEEEVAIELMRKGAHDYLMKGNLSRLAPAVTRELAEAHDRQEHRRAEAALRESEERFRSMADSAIDAIVAVDEDGRIRFFSRGAEAAFGYPAAEALGQPVTLLIPPERHEAHRAGMQHYLLTRESRILGKVVEVAGRRKDGGIFPLEMALSAAAVGGRTQFTAIIRDIGARKEMEAELQRRMEENERARTVLLSVLEDQREAAAQIRRLNTAYATLSQTNEAIVRLGSQAELFERICRIAVDTGGYLGAWIGLVDEDSKTLAPVASAGSLDGYIKRIRLSTDPAHPDGRGPSGIALDKGEPYYCNDFLNDPATARWHDLAREFGFRASVALPLRRRNFVVGTLSLYSAEAGAFDEQTRALLEEMAKDVSFALENFDREALRRQAEESVRESEILFRSVVEQNIAAIFMLDGGRFFFANPRACEILGYAPGELDGKNALDLIAEADRAGIAEMMRRILSREVDSVERNFSGLRKDGSLVDIGARATFAQLDNKPVILGVAQDIGERRKAEEEIQRYVGRLEQAMMATVEAVSAMVELRDPYTSGHERRVGELAAAIGGEMGLPQETITGLRMTGYVHDIGKISVPAEILSKPGRLSEIEFEIIKTHARSGYDILKGVEFPWPLPEVILQHHERLDGSGYPQHLKGGEIIQEARIMAVADVVESMASHRPYRPALGVDKALEEIERNSGRFYDPPVAEACLRLFREKGYELPK